MVDDSRVGRDDGERIVAGRRGYSIWGDAQRFALKYPLGTTRVEWEAVDGGFEISPGDDTVTFNLKSEWLARRSVFFRSAVRMGRALDNRSGLRLRGGDFGLNAQQLAATMNAELAARLGKPLIEAQANVNPPERGLLRKWLNPIFFACVAILLVLLVVQRIAH
jgi:hypothetical protein